MHRSLKNAFTPLSHLNPENAVIGTNLKELSRCEVEVKKPSKQASYSQFQGLTVVGSTGIEPATPTVSSWRFHLSFRNEIEVVTRAYFFNSPRVHSLYTGGAA